MPNCELVEQTPDKNIDVHITELYYSQLLTKCWRRNPKSSLGYGVVWFLRSRQELHMKALTSMEHKIETGQKPLPYCVFILHESRMTLAVVRSWLLTTHWQISQTKSYWTRKKLLAHDWQNKLSYNDMFGNAWLNQRFGNVARWCQRFPINYGSPCTKRLTFQ